MANQLGKRVTRTGKSATGVENSVGGIKVARKVQSGQFVTVGSELRTSVVMQAAEASGLLSHKSKRIAGRISPALLDQAKKRTGIERDTELIEFALANLALEDNFSRTFRKVRGTVDPKLKLGFERD